MRIQFIIFIIGLLGLAMATPYIMQQTGVVPSVGSSSTGDILPSFSPDILSTNDTRQTFYKWQDAKGTWHFGDTPPKGTTAIEVSVDTAANVLRPVAAPEAPAADTRTSTGASSIVPLPMTVNPAQIGKLIDDAKNVQHLMDDRVKSVDAATR